MAKVSAVKHSSSIATSKYPVVVEVEVDVEVDVVDVVSCVVVDVSCVVVVVLVVVVEVVDVVVGAAVVSSGFLVSGLQFFEANMFGIIVGDSSSTVTQNWQKIWSG